MPDWVLAIDFGTTSTAAAIRVEDRVHLVAIEGATQMPSMVFWREGTVGAHGELVLGRRIENLASRAPWCLERTPKRRIADEFMQLGDQQVRVTDAIAEILRKVASEASRLRGGQRPAEVRLTHPARWGEIRLEKLRQAAVEAGFPAPVLLPEPVAAAVYFASERLAPGEHVAVYDLGGGTFDTAVLRRTDDGGFAVAGRPGGREDLGGEDFDDLVYRHLGAQLPPDQWRSLRQAGSNRETAGNTWREANLQLQREARLAKEILSESPDYEVRIPVPVDTYLPVRADELNQLIRADLEETVAELERTIESAGLRPSDLSAIYLAGGSSRIPLVSELIRDRLGQSPDYLEDPKSVIALGAARAPIGAYAPARPPPPPPPPTDPQPPRPEPPPPPPTRPLPEPPPPAPPQTWPPPGNGSAKTPPSDGTAGHEPDRASAPSSLRRRAAPLVAVALALVAALVAALALSGGPAAPRRPCGPGLNCGPRPVATVPAPPCAPPAGCPELDALRRLQNILNVAGQGRMLIGQRDFNGAIANRRAVVNLLAGLGPVPPDLVASVRALRMAEVASLRADRSLRACGAPCSQAANDMATRLKRQFVAIFNPVASRYRTRTYAAEEI